MEDKMAVNRHDETDDADVQENERPPTTPPPIILPTRIITPINMDMPLRRSKRTAAVVAAVRMTMICSSPKKKKPRTMTAAPDEKKMMTIMIAPMMMIKEEEEEEKDMSKKKDETFIDTTTTDETTTVNDNDDDDNDDDIIVYGDIVPKVSRKMVQRNTNCLWTIHGCRRSPPPSSLLKRQQQQIERMKQEFYLFMSERQRIFVRRQRGDDDNCWSASPILRHFKWCNVYRELDRGTQFFRAHVIHHVIEPQLSVKTTTKTMKQRQQRLVRLRKILWASIVYRLVNRIETFLAIGFPNDQDENDVELFLAKATEYWKTCRTSKGSKKVKFFTGAHQTTNFNSYCQYVRHAFGQLDTLVKVQIETAVNTNELCDRLQKHVAGIGPFLAWQIYCDLQEDGHCLPDHLQKTTHPADHNNFDLYCQLGPGAKGASK
jgi:hypothetical protein